MEAVFPLGGGQASRVLPLPPAVPPSVLPAHVPCRRLALVSRGAGRVSGQLSLQPCVGGWKFHPYVLSSQDLSSFSGELRGAGVGAFVTLHQGLWAW